MRQLVYISTAVNAPIMAEILDSSRRNNAANDVTGLLYADGVRFLQALEGPAIDVEATYERIAGDPRHRALVILSRREVATREFGSWAMAAHVPGADTATLLARVETLTEAAAPSIRATFTSFARVRAAA